MNTIKVKTGGLDSEYILEEKEGGVSVKAPYLDREEDEEVVEYNVVDVEAGRKADFVRQFFAEDNLTLVRGGIAYNLDDILFDEAEVPEQIEPDNIEYSASSNTISAARANTHRRFFFLYRV
jgi:hypothetical protein